MEIVLPAVALVLALAATSGDALMCYECKSVGAADDSCSGEMLKSQSHMPIECSMDTMRSWYHKIDGDRTLQQIGNIFEVHGNNDKFYQRDPHPQMACVKMNLRVDNQPVTLRTCQTAKTIDVDPCKATRDKISKSYELKGSTTVEYCGLCESDRCNGSYNLTPTMIMSIVPLIGSIIMSLVNTSA